VCARERLCVRIVKRLGDIARNALSKKKKEQTDKQLARRSVGAIR